MALRVGGAGAGWAATWLQRWRRLASQGQAPGWLYCHGAPTCISRTSARASEHASPSYAASAAWHPAAPASGRARARQRPSSPTSASAWFTPCAPPPSGGREGVSVQ